MMNFNLHKTASDHIIVVAHRGVAGGNIPCNTMVAYETAIKQGADMIEIDVDITKDGKLVIFHPGMEGSHLNLNGSIHKMTYDEVKKLRYVNSDGSYTQFGILAFDDLLENFKGRCYINVDKYWENPQKIYETIKKHNMIEQCLVKSELSSNVVKLLEELSPELPFLPVVRQAHPMHKELMKKNINYVGAEVLFTNDDCEVASYEFIDMMHKDKKLVWINSIIYDYNVQLSGGHSDDTALSESMDKGWGWIADRGYDIIQTDWPIMLINYLKEMGKYNK